MECKLLPARSGSYFLLELIDTLWNVNAVYWICALEREYELIDTLWNVNLNSATAIVTPAAGINRYIMECK